MALKGSSDNSGYLNQSTTNRTGGASPGTDPGFMTNGSRPTSPSQTNPGFMTSGVGPTAGVGGYQTNGVGPTSGAGGYQTNGVGPATGNPGYQTNARPQGGGASGPSYATNTYPWMQSGQGQFATQQIRNAYRQYLGRDASDQEIASQLGNGSAISQDNINYAISNIRNSDEAMTFAKKNSDPGTNPQQPAQTQTGSPPATGSPTTANGGIPPSQGLQAPPQAPATAPDELRYVQPVDLSTVPAYNPYQYTQGGFQTYQAPTSPMGPVNFDQFFGPNQSGTNAQQNALIASILQNPETMNPQVVSQLKEASKEEALNMQRQGQASADQSAVARGTLGSGQASGDMRQRVADTINNILTSNRNTDVTAAQTNRQNVLDALASSEGIAQGQMGRATSAYNTRLGGQQAQQTSALQQAIAQEQFKQAAADSSLAGAGMTLQQQQAQAGENYKASQDAVQRLLEQFGINMGVASNAQSNYATDISRTFGSNAQLLQYLQYLEGQREFNDNLGFGYDQMNSNVYGGL